MRQTGLGPRSRQRCQRQVRLRQANNRLLGSFKMYRGRPAIADARGPSCWELKHFTRKAVRPLIVFLLAGLLNAPDEWPQFRGNPQLTGVASTAVPSTLKLLWTYEAGDSIESSAAIVGGTVYVGMQSADLLAIDLETGKLRWKYRAKDGIGESSPAVHDGVVYIGDLAGLLHAVRAADGKALWTFKTGGEIRSSPVVDGNRVLIGSYDGK